MILDRLRILKELAERFRSPESVKATVLDPKNCNPSPLHNTRPAIWGDLSLAAGFPSVLLLTEAFHRLEPKEKWDETAHLYVLKIRDAIEQNHQLPLSMSGGYAGICFALLQVSQGRTRYQRLLERLEDHLINEVRSHYVLPISNNVDQGHPSHPFMYDLISGIVGIGLYGLLCLDQEKWVSLVEEIVQVLIRFVQPLKVGEEIVPGWYLPSEMQFLQEEKEEYPEGNFNAGLAHGVPGILGFLSLALDKGICLPQQKEAIETVARWFQKIQLKTEKGFWWPGRVSWQEERSGKIDRRNFRDAWCYGTPGVARALYLAGDILKNEEFKKTALLGIQSVFERTSKEWGLFSPTICHGQGGLLLIGHLMLKDTQDAKLQKNVRDLEKQVWSFYQPEAPFGFQDLESKKEGGVAPINKAGFLDGATGVILTLLTVNGSSSAWHYPLLLSKAYKE